MGSSENQDGASVNDQEVLNQLVDLVLHSLHTTEQDLDPFVEYVKTLRNRFQDKNPQAFRAKFIKGYKILLETVAKID